MIINRNYKFIFIKSRKTASTSIELHLIKNTPLGNDIYVTPPDALKHGIPLQKRSAFIPAKYRPFSNQPIFFDRNWLAISDKFFRGPFRFPWHFSQRPSAASLKRVLGVNMWDTYKKVRCIRNPWHNLVSFWRWTMQAVSTRVSFTEFLKAALSGDAERIKKVPGCQPARFSMLNYMYIGDKFTLDFMIRFEDLDKSFVGLSELIGVEIPPVLIHEKKRQDVDYRAFYTDCLATEVADYFEDYLRITGYKF